MFKVKAQSSFCPTPCLGAGKVKYGSGSLSTTAFSFPPSLFFLSRKDALTKLQPHRAIHENQQGVISSLCLGVLSRALTHMPRQTAWSLPSHRAQQPRLPPVLASALLSLHFMTLLLSWLLCALWKQHANFFKSMSQFYLNSSAGFILLVCFSLLENGLIKPLIHETDLISSPRMPLQTRPVSCRAQTSGAFSGSGWSCPAHPTPAVFWSPPPALSWGWHMLSLFCVREVFGAMCVTWFPGSCYRQKTSPWERGKGKAGTAKAVPKEIWRVCELHKCTDLIVWHFSENQYRC